VVGAGALHVRAEALGRRVDQGEQQRAAPGGPEEGGLEEVGGRQAGAAAEGGEEVVNGAKVWPTPAARSSW
jgi:hypothetical protein